MTAWSSSDNFGLILSNADLTASASGPIGGGGRATVSVPAGAYYWEIPIDATPGGTNITVGLAKSTWDYATYLGSGTNVSWGYVLDTGQKITNGSFSTYGAACTAGDVIGIAFHATNGTIAFYKNGVSQGQAFSGLSGTIFPAIKIYNSNQITVNFGASAFAYTPPAGYSSLDSLAAAFKIAWAINANGMQR